CPSVFDRGECRDDSTVTFNPGGRMANHIHDSEDSNFEITSKRRKGFPSETNVKRGVRVVHGNKELREKLGRNDLCPCGSGRSFQELLPALGPLRRQPEESLFPRIIRRILFATMRTVRRRQYQVNNAGGGESFRLLPKV